MKKQTKVTVVVLLFLVVAVSLLMPLITQLHVDTQVAIALSVIISGTLTYLYYRKKKQLKHVLASGLLGWFLGMFVGVSYLMLINPAEAEGIFIGLCCTGPIGGMLGFASEFIPKLA